jgi:hypothetical protein
MADFDPHTEWGAVGRHDAALATVWEFATRSGAERVCVLLDVAGDGEAGLVVECEPGGPIAVAAGDEQYLVPAEVVRKVAPLPLYPMRPIPSTAITVDAGDGEIAAPIGAVASLGLAVLELARVLGGRTVATADFATASGGPLTIAAREGEPLVMQIGDQQFVMGEGWPAAEPDL